MAWAQTATFKVSETEGNPEHCYQIKNGNNIWMAANTAPTQNNVALFAFFTADGENAYKIYSIGKKQWVSYDKTSTTDNTKGFATLVDSRDAANPWKITATTIKGGESGFNVQPFNNDGTVGNRYWNWNGGVNVNQGYTYDDTRTIGIWRDPASTDAGSGWMFVQEVEYTITDKAGNVYEGNAQSVNGAAPSFSGAYGYTLTNEDWNGSKYTANIEFKFPVSKVGGVINATTIASAAVAKKWLATDNSVIMVQTSDYDANDNDWLWAIYPQFNNGAFTFKIKSIGQDKWIYTNASGSKVDGGNNDDSAGNAAGAVQLTDEGTAFAVVNSQTVSTCAFHYKVGNSNQYLSINSINDTKVYLGVHTGTHIGSDCYFSKVKTISPVAKIGEQVYYTLAEAVDAAKAAVETSGEVQTITLLADYNGAAIELPIGVTLNKGTFNADDVKVKDLTYVYNFVYGGTVKATQEGSVALGAAFPEIAAENKPFGVTASKPEGNVALADVDQNGNVTKNITVTFNLPFDAAADNASIEKWYYIQMHSYDASTTYNKYIQSVSATEVKWADNSVAAEKQDACTWAFIGNPYDGFKVVNYATGTAIAANGNAPVLSQDGVQWIVTGSTHKPDALHFCLKYPNGEIKCLNANAETGALGFWQNPDAGSTMWVTLRDINSEVTALTSLVEQAQALVEGWSGKVGELTEESKNAVSAAITTANTAIGSKKNLAVAKQDLDAAIGNVQHIEAPSFDGEGTEASPYLIDSADKLATLRDGVNGGEAYEGKYFKLTSDIALNGEWTAIGNGSRNGTGYTGNAFKGVFDGDNKTISGLTITSTTGAKAAIGLFGVVDGGTVKNVNLTNVNINVPNSDLAGAAIGMMLNGATAEGITVSGAVVGHDGVGGIVGRLIIDGTIANCTNNASVTSNYGGIGGIVGKAYYEDGANTATFASITNCTNKGTITAPMYVGGIVGLARANVTNCVNEGAIVGGTQTGGIIGQLMAAGTVSANENKATVGGTSHVGGIIGDYSQSSSYTYNNVSIANNTNRGELSAQQCAAIMGCNNIDGFTAMTATGNQSFYFVEGLELFGNPEDMVIDATNKFVVPVAQVGAETFYTFAEAAAAVQAGGEIKLLADATVEGTLALPAGIKLTSNGHTVNGSIRMLGDLTLNGPLTITGGLWVGKSGETLTATLSGDKLTASYFMFQHGTYTINADIDALHGYLSFGGTFEVNSTIHTTGTNGEVLYIRGNVNLNADAVLDSDNSVFLDNDNAVLTLKPGSKVDSNVSITTSGAKLNIDATGMTAGASANITGTVTNSGNGTIAVVGNDKFEAKIVDGKVVLAAKPVAKIGETGYNTLADALEATKTMTGDVTVEILDKVTFNQPLIGNYTSINFVGKDTDAEMYLDVQGYTTATGKKVSFTDLKLSKSEGGYIANAGFMNVAFGVYDVAEVTYTNCTFANGAYAAFGKVTYTGCTFKKSWEKYGLWAYGDADVTVDGCTFADYRGIKMYAEGGADASVAKANLTVKNTNFSAVDNKPAIVLTYGESVVLEGNTYSSTGTFELDLDGKPNGVAVTSDVAPVCVNDNGACGVLVDGKIYTTVAQAAEVATSGSKVTLLHSSQENVEFAYGVTIDKNNFEAPNVTTEAPFADYIKLPQGVTQANYKEHFGANTVSDGTNYYATMAKALEGIHKGTATVLYCKPGADLGTMTHGHVCRSLTIYGNGAKISGGEQDFELDTYKFCHSSSNTCEGVTADVTLTVKHLDGCGAWGQRTTSNTLNIVFEDCKDMNRVYISGTTGINNITLTNCSFLGTVNKLCTLYSNANGTINVTGTTFSGIYAPVNLNHKVAGTQVVNVEGCEFTDCGTAEYDYAAPVRVLSSVEGAQSTLTVSNTTFTGTKANKLRQTADILLDYGVGTTNATVNGSAAKVVVENENNVGAETTTSTSDNSSFTTAKPVAKIGDVEYMTLAAAVETAQDGATITLIADVKLSEMVTIPAGKTITLDLNGKSISMQESIIATAYAINNLGNLTIKDGVGGGSVNARGMYNGYGNGGENVASAKLTINGGTFNAKGTNGGAAIFNYGVADIQGGNFTSIGGYSLNNQSGASMTIAAGVTANNGIYANGATLVVNGGEINGNRSGCHVLYAWNSNVTIAGGTFHNNNSGNSTTMAGGTTKLTIDGGTFSIANGKSTTGWTSCLIDATGGGKYEINGGEFKGHFRVQANCAMEINGGTFENTHGEAYVNGGTVAVNGGTFTDAAAQKFATDNLAAGYELGADGTVVAKPVAEVNGVKYTSLADALAAVQTGGEIKLLANIDGDIEVPAGVKLNGNGFAVNGVVTALGEITFAGVTKAASFNVENTNTVVNIPAGASLQLTGTGRMVIGHGCTFNITGTIKNAKTADKATLTPSLVMPGASFTGAGVTFNVTNAYISAPSSYCSSSKSASGTFDFNINNSIWENAGKLAFESQSTAATVNFDLVSSVLNTGSHLVFGVSRGEVVIDDSNVNVGKSNQIENQSTMTIKNGSVVNGAVATSSNAKNPGTIIVENATYAVTGEFSGSDLGTGTLIIKKDATVSAGSITKANIQIDATNMVAGEEINLTANLANLAGTLSVINNDKLEAKIVDGKIVLAAKPVAKIGEQGYATLEEAFKAATEDQTITLVDDATPALTSQRAITKAAVIDLGGKTLTLTEDDLYFGTTTFKNGTIVVDPSVKPSTAVFWMFANQTLTFDNVKVVATGVTGTYLIGLDGNNSDLNLLNGSEILVENTTALDLDIICVNASTGNDIKVENSKVNVTNLDGRVFFRGNYTVKDSEVNLAGITKAGFRIEAGQTLSIEGTSTVIIEGEPRDGGIHLTDLTATYTKAETATVNATVNEPKVAKIGENTYRTLAQAVAAVEDGGTITLIANETFTKNNRYNNGGYWDGLGYSGDKSFTIDLGGFTIGQNGDLNDYLMWFKNDGAKANTITLKNGTLDAGTTAYCALATASSNAQKITVNLENIKVINNISNGATLKIRAGAELNVKAGTEITGKDSYLGIECWAATVNIYDGAKINMNGTSSYCGCLVGASGKGTVNVYGGEGQSKSGGFIAMTSGGTINIEGGKWIANTDGTYANGNKSVLVAQSENGAKSIVNVTGGTFKGGYNCYGAAVGDAQINIKGGNFNANPTSYVAEDYIAVENNGVWTVEKAAAKIGKQGYATLEKAFKAATSDCTIEILSDVTVDYNWDARYTGGKFTVPVTINGNGKTIKFTASVNDNNYQAPFRFEADATVKNLTIDMSEVTDNRFRAISSKGNLTVDGCNFIGKDESLNCRAIIFGEGAGANVGKLAIAITNSEFINWKRGITDNENAQDVKTVTITGNTLTDAGVGVSAKETVTFTGNTVAGAYVNIKSYTAGNKLAVTATGNTLEANTDAAYNVIDAGGVVNAEGFNVVAKGNNFNGYTGTDGIWGEVWGNARESFVIKVLDANGNVMGTTSLNNIGGIINGNVNVSWNLKFNAAANTDEYWTMEWTTAPTLNNMPAKVELWVDGTRVSGGDVVLNGPDDLNKINVIVTDAEGKVTSCQTTVANALAAAKDGEIVNLLWKEGAAPLAMNGSVFGKKVTIKGTAKVDWSKGFLFVGRGGEGNATVTFDGANLTSASDNASTGIHVSGREKGTNNKYDGTLVIKNSTIDLDYLINKGEMTLDNATLTVKNGCAIGGRPAGETESGQDATATISLTNASKFVVNNHNGMGLGYEAIGVMNVDATSTFETTQSFLVTAKGTMNLAGTAKVEGTLTNNGSIVLTALDATLTSTECGNVTTNVAEKVVYYNNGAYTLRTGIAKIGEVAYLTLQDAVNAVQYGDTITLTNDIAENVTLTEKTGLYYTIDGAGKTMKGSINVTSLSDTEDNRRITIKNIQFVDDSAAKVDFISSVDTNHYPRLTVEGCTFTGSGDATDVAVRLKSSHSVVIKDCTGTGLHSFIQNTSGWNLTIEGVTVTDSKGAFALGTVQDVTVKGCTADVQGYGIRLDAQYNNNAVLKSNNIKAFIPVVVRKAEVVSKVTVEGTNTMTATNTDGLWCAVGTSEYEANGQMPTAATGQVVVTINDTNLDNEGIYGDYVVLAGEGTEAEPYLIKDIKELVAFRNSVNGGETRYSAPGVWVALAADIDLDGLNWVGIGSVTAEHGFMGNFDGKGFKIKNLTITDPALDSDDYAYAGFFSVTEGTDKNNQNTIKNLTIENVTITTTGHIVSAAIAYPYYTIVDNVKVCGNIAIQGGDYTAGVLAYTRRCVNASNLSIVGNNGSFVKGNKVVGGVISDIQMNGGLTAVYSKFSAEGITVSGEKSVGGISGIISTQTLNGASVKNVTLNSKDGFAGIVAGRLGDTSVITDVVAENVTGATAVVGAIYELAKAVQAKIGNTYYATLDDALKAEGNEVELLTTYEVVAGETKTLDLKGKTVTMVYTAKATKNHTMVSNSGNLTIESSVAGGKLSYTYAGENLGTTYAVNTVTSEPGSVLTVKSGTIENLTYDSAVIAYAIDGRTNGGAGDVTVNIEGGVITSKRQAVRIFANSTTNTGALNISGGEFTGRVIVQNASAKANKAALNITGGTFNANEYKSDVLYVGGSSSAEIDINATVSGGTFNGEITETNVTNFISGGTYKNAVEAAYCADGYMPNKNVNGTYGVVAVADAYASIDGVTYGSLKAAVTAAKTGETITLLQNVKESVTISKALTLDGAGKTLTGMITTKINGKVTIKNLYFNGDGQKQSYAVRADNMGTLTVENCTAVDYLYGFLYANKSNDKIVVKDVTVENCAEYGAYLVAFNKASFENFEVIGTTKYGVAVANAGNRIVNFKNVSFDDAETPLNINETGTGKVTFNFSGINDMSKDEFYTSQYVNVVAAAQVGTKVCGSLQDAVVAANDGETVKVLADVNMTTANFVTQVDGYATLVNVAGKAVTIDLNGKKVTVNAAHADLNGKAKSNMLMSVFHADPNGTLTLTDSSAEGTGTVELFANDAKVYALIVSENQYDKSHPGKIFVNGGNYVADKLNDSMIFADINEVITVNGGNFHLGNVGEGTNDKPWIFNASGSNTMHINVNGGTYNANVAKQYWTNEVNLGEGLTTTNNGDGTWTVVPGVATVGEELFGTIQEALDAAQDGETVKLIADVTLDTKKYTTQVDNLVVLFNVKGKAVTFDLNGKKIDVNASAANLGGKMLAGVFSADLEGNFTITDNSAERTGAVTVTVNDAKVYSVFLSENAGDKTKSGKMTVNAGNFTTIGKVANAMIYADTDKVITINGGTFICDGVSTSEPYPWLVNTHVNNEKQVTVNGGTFNVDINHQYRPFEVFVPETLAVKANDNGTWTIVPAQAYVTEMLGNYVNEPGSREHKVGYATVAEAIAATNDLGKVVTILAGDYTMDIAANKAGVTVQGEVDENGQNLVNITGRVVPSTGTTVKNLNVKNEKKGDYDCALYVDGKDIVIDGVNLSGYNGMRMGYAKGNITIKNSVIEGSSNAVHFDGSEGGVIAFENSTITGWCAYASTIESVTYTNCTLNKGKYFGQRFYNKNVNFVDCTFGEGFKIELTGSKQNVTFTDADMTMEDVKALMKKESYITSHNVKLNDTQVTYAVSAQGKLYNTLQAAIDDLPVGGTDTYWANLKSDNVLTAPVTVPAGVKVVVNLNGYDITYTSDVAGEAMITNNGELGFEGNGEVVYTYTGAADAAYTKGNYTIANRGKLTIDGGIIKNATAAMKHASYAIDNEGNATLVINGGQVINTNNYAIRQFASGNNVNSITVNDGEVSGTRAVWMQAAGSNTADAPAITLNVTGGKLTGTGETGYKLAVYSYNYGNSLKNVAINIEGGEIVGDIALTGGKNKTVAETVEITGGTITNIYSYADDAVAEKTINITGGEFLNEISETYLAWGYQLKGDAAPYVVEHTGRRESVTIVDGQMTEFVNEEDIEVGTLTYKRELYDDLLWNALFVPFEIPVSTLTDLGLEVVYFNDVHSYDDDNNGTIDRMTMESIKLTNGTLRANHPYMFRRTSDDAVIDLNLTLTDVTLYSTNEDALIPVGCSSAYTNYEISGTYQQMSAADLDGRLIINEEGNWTLMNEAYTLSPFRLHLTIEQKAGSPVIIEESALRAISIRVIGEGNGDTTDIKYYDVENQNVELIFDLQGRRVLEPKKGGIYIINGKKVYYNK